MRTLQILLFLLVGIVPGWGAADILSVNDTLTPREQYRRLSLVLLIGEGVDEAIMVLKKWFEE